MRITTTILAFVLLALIATSSVGFAQGNSNPNVPELEEAHRLGSSVVSLFKERKFEEAHPLAKRALELREKVLDKDDPSVVTAVLNLAEVQYARAKFTESKDLFERALQSYRRTKGPQDESVAKVLDRLAINYYLLGRTADAETSYRQALVIRENKFGPDDAATAQSLYNLAEFYQFEGQYKQAEPLYERLIETRKRTQAKGELIDEALDRYACLLRKEKRNDEANKIEEDELLLGGRAAGVRDQAILAGVVNGKAIRLVQPPYPYEARAAHASGKVSVRILINEDGNVVRVCGVEGPKLLIKASERAAAQSKFTPTKLEGRPVKVTGVIIYNYVAQ